MLLYNFLWYFAIISGTWAASGISQSQSEALSLMPACGLTCVAMSAPAAGCELLDFHCQCTSQKMADLTTNCALTNCTLEDSFKLLKAQAAICEYPTESRRPRLKSVLIGFFVVTKVVVSLRLVLRLLSQGNFGADDWLILLAMAVDSAAFYAALRVTNHGLGEHIWTVPLADLKDILFWFYIIVTLYMVTNSLIKFSILAFYLRIFAGKRFQILCWIAIGLGAAIMTAFSLVSIFQCTPVSNAWMVKPPDGTCVNNNAVSWAFAGFTVAHDAMVLVIPLAEVWALQMSLRKKLSVMCVFVLGGFVVIASLIRLNSLHGFGRTSDPTWNNGPTTMWSAIELGVGMICSSIPGIYSGARKVYPRFRKFTARYISMNDSKAVTNQTESFKMESTILSDIPANVPYERTLSSLEQGTEEGISETSSARTIIIQTGNEKYR